MIEGRVWKFGDDIDTDVIIPGRYLDNYSPEHLARHVMEGVDASFSRKVRKGDIIVAGERFGIGSSREQAPIALKSAGVHVIVAESFARIFFRNAVNQGMLPITCRGCSSAFESGDVVRIDVEEGFVSLKADARRRKRIDRPSPIVSEIIEAGGLINKLRAELGKE